MSRGGFGGRGGGRGGFGGANMPPMGLTFLDLQTMSREPTAMYPEMDPMPVLTTIQEAERKSCQHEHDLIYRLRHSKYYIVEETKSKDLPRYSDRYRPTATTQPKLVESDLHKEFFPPDLWDVYFNPKTKAKKARKKKARKLGIDDIEIDDDDDKEGSDEDEDGKKDNDDEELGDYEDEEEDDYNENYFETGSQEDADDVGGGGEDHGGGGGGDD